MPGSRHRPYLWVIGVGLTLIAGFLSVAVTPEAAAPGRPTAPLRLTSFKVDADDVTLAWTGEADGYRVRVGTTLDAPLLDVTTTTPYAKVPALDARISRHQSLRYRVEAIGGTAIPKAASGTLTIPPGLTLKPQVSELESRSVRLSWPAVDNATAYDIAFVPRKGSPSAVVHRIAGSESAFRTTTLKPNAEYTVRVRAVNEGVVGPFSPKKKFRTRVEKNDIVIGAWNICSEACSGYGGRVGGMARQVQASNIDILTLQEAGGKRVGPATNAAFSGGPRGFTLAQGGAKARYIFYRTELFEQLAGGHFSVGTGRWITWARFRDRTTTKTFIVASVHITNGKGSKPDAIRSGQTQSLLRQIGAINTAGDPVVLAGDFNTGRHRPGDRVIGHLNSTGYHDSLEVAQATEGARINTGSRRGSQAIMSGHHVDHIFVTAGLTVPHWKQTANLRGTTYAGPFLTDHNMIAATVRLKRPPSPTGKATPRIVIPLTAPKSTGTPPSKEVDKG